MHVPDPDDEPDPLELDVLTDAHEPPLQISPDAHELHTSPPVPHAVEPVPCWHVLFESQHPVQVALEHPEVPLLAPPFDPLLVPADPPSSPPLLLLELPLYEDPLSSDDPPELVLPPPFEPDPPPTPEEDGAPLSSQVPVPAGADSPAAQDATMRPATSATSLPAPPRPHSCIPTSLRGACAETTSSASLARSLIERAPTLWVHLRQVDTVDAVPGALPCLPPLDGSAQDFPDESSVFHPHPVRDEA